MIGKARPVRDDITLVAAYLYQTRRNIDEKQAEDWAKERERANPVKFKENIDSAKIYFKIRKEH